MALITTATLEPPDPAPPEKVRLVRLNDPHRTAAQVSILNTILAEARQCIDSHSDIGHQYEIDPRVREAAALTYEAAAYQMRNILDEQDRWLLKDSEGDSYAENLARANLTVVEEQKKLMRERQRPCHLLSVMLRSTVRQDTGQIAWLAFPGPVLTENSLLGIGPSPAAAMHAFDESYFRQAEQAASVEGHEQEKAASPEDRKPKRRSKKK